MTSNAASESLLPTPPTFSNDELQRCRDTGDYSPILFEWYKFVGSLAVVVTNIQRESPAFRFIPVRTYHVLIGLLNRCSRLMLSNVALSHEGTFGETTAIIDRCIFESALKIMWLCKDPSDERVVRYIADGLRTEIEFKTEIEKQIAERDGNPHAIETRMLGSIERTLAAARLTSDEVMSAKKLPDIAALMTDVGFDRLAYVIRQRIGSHHVHGTWPSLLTHYLEEVEEEAYSFRPRDHDCPTHINQYMSTSITVLHALSTYIEYALREGREVDEFVGLFESVEKEIMRIYTEAIGGDLRS